MPLTQPSRGDVHWAEFSPTAGTEQAGRRPALVLTDQRYHAVSRRAFVVPVTSRRRGWPTEVDLPAGFPIVGTLLVDQARFVDRVRLLDFIASVPDEVVADAQEILAALLGLENLFVG